MANKTHAPTQETAATRQAAQPKKAAAPAWEGLAKPTGTGAVLALQRKVGNQAVTRLLGGLFADVTRRVENTTGHDLSDVQVHAANAEANQTGVDALTRGRAIHLSSALAAKPVAHQRHVFGHELAHVVQQASGRARAGMSVAERGALEREADATARQALSLGPVAARPLVPLGTPAAAVVQHYGAKENEKKDPVAATKTNARKPEQSEAERAAAYTQEAAEQADSDFVGTAWITPDERKQLEALIVEFRKLGADAEALAQQSNQGELFAAAPDATTDTLSTDAKRQIAKTAGAPLTAFSRENGPTLTAGARNLKFGELPTKRLMLLAAISHLSVVLNVAQLLLLSDDASYGKIKADLRVVFDGTGQTKLTRLSTALKLLQNMTIAAEGLITALGGFIWVASKSEAWAERAKNAAFIAAEDLQVSMDMQTFMKSGFWVSGARITGALNIIGTIRGIISLATAKNAEEFGAAIRDTLFNGVGAVRFVEIVGTPLVKKAVEKAATESFEKSVLARLVGRYGIKAFPKLLSAEAAGTLSLQVWAVWLEYEAFRWVWGQGETAVRGLIEHDAVRALEAVRSHGENFERQMHIVAGLALATDKAKGGNTAKAQGYRQAYQEALRELQSMMRDIVQTCSQDHGSTSPGHYKLIRNRFTLLYAPPLQQEILGRATRPDALPEEVLMGGYTLSATLRQIWASYDDVLKEARQQQGHDF